MHFFGGSVLSFEAPGKMDEKTKTREKMKENQRSDFVRSNCFLHFFSYGIKYILYRKLNEKGSYPV